MKPLFYNLYKEGFKELDNLVSINANSLEPFIIKFFSGTSLPKIISINKIQHWIRNIEIKGLDKIEINKPLIDYHFEIISSPHLEENRITNRLYASVNREIISPNISNTKYSIKINNINERLPQLRGVKRKSGEGERYRFSTIEHELFDKCTAPDTIGDNIENTARSFKQNLDYLAIIKSDHWHYKCGGNCDGFSFPYVHFTDTKMWISIYESKAHHKKRSRTNKILTKIL